MASIRPFYEDVRAHYDLSNDFFALFLDGSMTYSCAYFEREGMTLAEAQRAKIDLSLGKCDLRPGHRLLDIGCGWAATALRAAEHYKVDVVGLTLSERQHEEAVRRAADLPAGAGRVEFRLRGWEEFEEPVDRIVSIGAFEHFRAERYAAFFDKCRRLLPEDGRMMLHSIVLHDAGTLRERGIEVTHENVLFAKFIGRHIFPGGQLRPPKEITDRAEAAGFRCEGVQSLQPHYARTLDRWAENLRMNRERAVGLTSEEVYEVYMRYLTGCAAHFRSGHLDVVQFTLVR